jgi:small subunit ribosomal protein S16
VAAKIKLKRIGKRNQPFYRIIVIDQRKSTSSGDYLDNLGYYNPMVEPKQLKIDGDKAKAWISKGALPTEKVAKLLKQANVA